MCAIFGLLQQQAFNFHELNAVSAVLRHRGPDDEGFAIFNQANGFLDIYGGKDTPHKSKSNQDISWFPDKKIPSEGFSRSGGLLLGHRRLSIIDLSVKAHQPMSDRLRRYWITYNGEIYNYVELRNELKTLGHNFLTESDTEVILAAYSEWGSECLSRFNGMWAIAIFDRMTANLFLARDRFGVKPLYYCNLGDRLAFGSEIKLFTCLSGWKSRADRQRLLDFAVWNISDHSKFTMFDGVLQLPPGHFISVNLSAFFLGGELPKFIAKKWYQLPTMISDLRGKAASEGLRTLLTDSIVLRMRSDVPIGSCLSGGLDSSSIVSLMGKIFRSGIKQEKSELHSFTARSYDKEFDEFAYAQSVIERAGTISHSVIPEPNLLFQTLDKLAWHNDEPFGSTSVFAQWCVFKMAFDSGVKVMLDGQGADEILGGYRGFFGANLAGILRRGALTSWYKEIRDLRNEVGFSTLRSCGYSAAYLMPSLIGFLGRFDGRSYADKEWIAQSSQDIFQMDPFLAAGSRCGSIKEMSIAQVTTTNLPMLLHWEDRNSMAHSVEARVPFLDYRVVEFCLSLIDDEKVGGGVSKKVLRNSMRGIVPDAVLDRRDKMGFVTAESLWMCRDEPKLFRAAIAEAVEKFPNIFSTKLVDQFDQTLDGKRPFDHRYWRAISISSWAKAFNVEI